MLISAFNLVMADLRFWTLVFSSECNPLVFVCEAFSSSNYSIKSFFSCVSFLSKILRLFFSSWILDIRRFIFVWKSFLSYILLSYSFLVKIASSLTLDVAIILDFNNSFSVISSAFDFSKCLSAIFNSCLNLSFSPCLNC